MVPFYTLVLMFLTRFVPKKATESAVPEYIFFLKIRMLNLQHVYNTNLSQIQGVHCNMLESKCIFWAEKLFSQG